jgi:NAD(P)-dependent dehydrogenase (short-subunit alcohol dehydrogenase family)
MAGRRVVVTGASDGIGFAIAEAFAAAGDEIMVVARGGEKLARAAAILAEAGGSMHSVVADLACSEGLSLCGQAVRRIWGDCDVLVNNAGLADFGPFSEVSEARLRALLSLNVTAPYHLTQALFPLLCARRGCVINISSYFARRMPRARPSTAYSLTKAALEAFTKALAVESGPKGVRVNAIAPGPIATSRTTAMMREQSEVRAQFATIESAIPLQRMGSPADVASAALWLASNSARWTTGIVLAVDGGFTAG